MAPAGRVPVQRRCAQDADVAECSATGVPARDRVSSTVASNAATAPPATTSAMGTGEPSGPSPTSGVTSTPPPNMQAPSTADAEPAADEPRSTPRTVAFDDTRPRVATTTNSGGSTASTP